MAIKTGRLHVWAMIYSPDAKFATGGFKDKSNIWDVKMGELFTKLKHDHKYWVYDITLSRNNRLLASA